MIRAVQFQYFMNGRDDHMAFLSTVTDNFLTFNGSQCWDSWEDLDSDMHVDTLPLDQELSERLKGLCPVWFIDGHAILEL